MSRRCHTLERGLTLIEVVAATVLLTVLAATGVSLIRGARAAIERPRDDGVFFDLALFADALVEHPEWFGIREPLYELSHSDITLVWPARPDERRGPLHLRSVNARLVRPADPAASHAWLVIHRGGSNDVSVSRLVEIPRERGAAR